MISSSESGSADDKLSITRTGYSFNTILLQNGTAEELSDFLEKKISPNAEAYDNTPVVLDVSNVNNLYNLEYAQLQQVCAEHSMYLIGLSGIHSEERAKILTEKKIPIVNSTRFARMREENFKPRVITKAVEIQVPVRIPEPYQVKVPVEVKRPEKMMVINHSLRAGESVSAPGNSVLVLGNVARTARIVASHNIFVFGDLYGEVYAGAPKDRNTSGDEKGLIYVSGVFQPTLVAVAGNYQTADDMESNQSLKSLYGEDTSVIVSLANGKSLNYVHVKDVQSIQSRF